MYIADAIGLGPWPVALSVRQMPLQQRSEARRPGLWQSFQEKPS